MHEKWNVLLIVPYCILGGQAIQSWGQKQYYVCCLFSIYFDVKIIRYTYHCECYVVYSHNNIQKKLKSDPMNSRKAQHHY